MKIRNTEEISINKPVSSEWIVEAMTKYIEKHPVSKKLVSKKFELMTESNNIKIKEAIQLTVQSDMKSQNILQEVAFIKGKVETDVIRLYTELTKI